MVLVFQTIEHGLLKKSLSEKEYQAGLIIAQILEYNKGFKAIRVNKPTNKGTTIKYEQIKSEEDRQQALEKIKTLNAEFVKTFGSSVISSMSDLQRPV